MYLSHIEHVPGAAAFEPRFGRSVSLDQAAGILRVSRRTVYNWIRTGRLQTIRTLGGKSQRVLLASLHAFTREQHGHAPPLAPMGASSFELS